MILVFCCSNSFRPWPRSTQQEAGHSTDVQSMKAATANRWGPHIHIPVPPPDINVIGGVYVSMSGAAAGGPRDGVGEGQLDHDSDYACIRQVAVRVRDLTYIKVLQGGTRSSNNLKYTLCLCFLQGPPYEHIADRRYCATHPPHVRQR